MRMKNLLTESHRIVDRWRNYFR